MQTPISGKFDIESLQEDEPKDELFSIKGNLAENNAHHEPHFSPLCCDRPQVEPPSCYHYQDSASNPWWCHRALLEVARNHWEHQQTKFQIWHHQEVIL